MQRRRRISTISTESLEQRVLLSAAPVRVGDIAWFADATQPQIHKYDLQNEAWLTSVALAGATGPADFLEVDADGIYVGSGHEVYRYGIDGGNRTLMLSTTDPVDGVHVDGNILFVNQISDYYTKFTSLDKTSGSVIDTISNTDDVKNSEISIQGNRILGRSDTLPSDTTFVSYTDNGHFLGQGNGPYHGDFPAATKTWVTPDGRTTIDDSGTLYTVDNLKYRLTLSTTVSDIDFYGNDVLIAASGQSLIGFDQSYRETGRVSLDHAPDEIFAGNTNVITFTANDAEPQGFDVGKIPLAELSPANPDTPVNPVGLKYSPDRVFQASDGNVLLYSWKYQSIFRWNPTTASYGETIPLAGFPKAVDYSVSNRLYLAYESGEIRQIDLNAAIPVEVHFADLPGQTHNIIVADTYVIGWSFNFGISGFTQKSFRPNGTGVNSVTSFTLPSTVVWSHANQKLISRGFNSSELTVQEVNASGTAYPNLATGAIGQSSGYYSFDGSELVDPVRISPDGTVLLFGGGVIGDGDTFKRRQETIQAYVDAEWFDDQLFTMHANEQGTLIRAWDASTFAPRREWKIVGTPNSILPLKSDQLLIVTTDENGIPQFQTLEADLRNSDPNIGFTLDKNEIEVSEDGTTGTFSLVLNSQPAGNVVVDVKTSNSAEIGVNIASLTFTPQTWNVPQQIIVSGIDDSAYDGDRIAYVIASLNSTLSDAGFASAQPQTIVVRNLENEGNYSGVLPSVRIGDVTWLMRNSTSRIDRFDAATGLWLAPIDLDGRMDHPTAFTVDQEGIYVAFGASTYRYNIDGGNRRLLLTAQGIATSLLVDGDLLFVVDRRENRQFLSSRNKQNGVLVDDIEVSDPYMSGASISIETRHIFGKVPSFSSSSVYSFGYANDGQLTRDSSAGRSDSRQVPDRTWVYPDGTRVMDSSGAVSTALSMSLVGQTTADVSDAEFVGNDVAVVVSGSMISAYSRALQKLGAFQLSGNAGEVITNQSTAFALIPDLTVAEGFRIEAVPVTALNVTDSGSPIDPSMLAYTPDQVLVANDGTVLLLKRTLNSIFTWNPETQSYGANIQLSNEPVTTAYSTLHNTLYVAYFDGTITQIDLNASSPTERPFASLDGVYSLAVADSYVVAISYSLSLSLRRDGTIADSDTASRFAPDPQWNSAKQKLYYVDSGFSSPTLRYVQINANGTAYPDKQKGDIGATYKTFNADSYFVRSPVRISPDGRFALLGTGAIFGGNNLLNLQPFALANDFFDATWIGDRLVTIRQIANGTEVQEWNSTTFELLNARFLSGNAFQIKAVGDGRVVCMTMNAAGIPQFKTLDRNLNIVSESPRVVVTQTDGGTVVSEDGATDTVHVALTSRPNSNVIIRINSNRSNEVTTAASPITFTPDNWDQPQSVVVTGIDGTIADGDRQSILTFAVDSSISDPDFTGAVEAVNVTNLDDDATYAGFLPAMRINDVAWFVSRSSGRIERFDLTANRWLATMVLPGNAGHATAAAIDAEGIYIAFGGLVYRYDPAGLQRTYLITAHTRAVYSMFTDGNLLLLATPYLVSLQKSNGAVIQTSTSFRAVPAVQIPSLNLLFASSASPTWQSYSDAGELSPLHEFLIERVEPPNNRLWLSPANVQLFDSIGRIYSTQSRRQIGYMGTSITDMDFLSDGAAIVLAGNVLTMYSESLLPVGSLHLTRSPQEIFAYSGSNSIYTFLASRSSPHGISQQRVAVTSIKPDRPSTPPSPTGLAFTPDSIALTTDNRLLLFSKIHRCIFQWNLLTQKYDATIPLIGTPKLMTYAANTNTVFIADESGLLSKVDLSATLPTEISVRFLLWKTDLLTAVGNHLFAIDRITYTTQYRIYRNDGIPVTASAEFQLWGNYAWSEAGQKLYITSNSNDASPTYVYSKEIEATGDRYRLVAPGGFGNRMASVVDTVAASDRNRVSPSGDFLALGSGQILNAKTLLSIGSIAGTFSDLQWLQSELVTLKNYGTQSLIQRWMKSDSGKYQERTHTTVPGSPIALLTSADRVVAITMDAQSRPVMTLLDESLYRVPDVLNVIPATSRLYRTSSPTIQWTAVTNAVDYSTFLTDDEGRKVGEYSTIQQGTAFTPQLPNGVYRVQVRAHLADGTNTLWSAPYRFQIDALRLLAPVSVATIQTPFISWQGHSDAETYEIWVNNLDTKTVAYRASGIRSRGYSIAEKLPIGQYAVWVRSVSLAGVVSPWCERRVFEIIHAPVVISGGIGGTNDFTPKISWQLLPSVESYELIIQRTSDQRNIYRATNIKQDFLQIPGALPADQYQVWVRAWINGRAVSAWGPGSQLTVYGPPLVTYVGSALSWQTIRGAVSYDIKLVSLQSSETLISRTGFTGSSLAMEPTLLPGKYRIESRSNYSSGDHSNLSVFEFEVFHPAVVLTFPPAATIDQTPFIQWGQVTGAATYEITLKNAVSGRLLYQQSGITESQHRIAVPLPNGLVTIWVQATFPDSTRSALAAGEQIMIGPAPRISRTDNSLSWSPINDATHYELWVNVIEPGQQNPVRFVRENAVIGLQFELPDLRKGSYRVWIRAVRAEAGTLYYGQWSPSLDFDVVGISHELDLKLLLNPTTQVSVDRSSAEYDHTADYASSADSQIDFLHSPPAIDVIDTDARAISEEEEWEPATVMEYAEWDIAVACLFRTEPDFHL